MTTALQPAAPIFGNLMRRNGAIQFVLEGMVVHADGY